MPLRDAPPSHTRRPRAGGDPAALPNDTRVPAFAGTTREVQTAALRPAGRRRLMLLIPCPWCGPRNQIEFTYGGDATVRRPAADAPDAAWFAYVYLRDNPHGTARRAVAAQRRLPQLVRGAPRHARRTRSSPAPDRRSPGRGSRSDAARIACRTAASSIARGRCASSSTASRYRRVCRRHAGLGAARQRRPSGRPQLQVSPPARHLQRRHRGAERAGAARRAARAPSPTCARPRSSSTTGSSPRARIAGRRCASTSARSTTRCRR